MFASVISNTPKVQRGLIVAKVFVQIWSLQVCWKCGATKGSVDPQWSYTNLSPHAPWRGAHAPIWDVRPAFANLATWIQLFFVANKNIVLENGVSTDYKRKRGKAFGLPILYQVGFEEVMIGPDVLHVFHLRVGRDLLGSALRVLVAERYWPGSNIEHRLAYATASLKRWCKQQKLSCTLRQLTKQNLNWQSVCLGRFGVFLAIFWNLMPGNVLLRCLVST